MRSRIYGISIRHENCNITVLQEYREFYGYNTNSTSTTTAATTPTQRVDYISALNAGSGLNTTQIVDTLVNAEVLPKQNKINEQVEEKNVSISSLGQVKSDFTTFDTNLALLANQNALVAASSSTAVTVTADNTAALKTILPQCHRFNACLSPHAIIWRLFKRNCRCTRGRNSSFLDR